MVSQRSRVCDIDLYSCAAEKFISLVPACCSSVTAEDTQVPAPSFLRDGFPLDKVTRGGSLQIRSRRPRRSFSGVLGSYESGDIPRRHVGMQSLNGVQPTPAPTAPSNYHLYLMDARRGVNSARRACSNWSSAYDGVGQDVNGVAQTDTKADDVSAEDSSVSAGDSGIFVTREGQAGRGGFDAFGSPNIGPFLGILLARLEMMPQNDVYTNLQLTALIGRLALYPQPLLRSFLLSHSLVFQPSVRSLFQVRESCFVPQYLVKPFQQLKYFCVESGLGACRSNMYCTAL